MAKFISILSFILLPLITFSQDISGEWNGILQIQSMKLRLVFKVSSTPEGWSGTMDSPDQGAKDIPLSKVVFEKPNVFFEIAMAGIQYQGSLDGQEINGTFKQGILELPLKLTREIQEQPEIKKYQEPIRPYPYYEEQVTFYNQEAGIRLAGTLTLPQKTGKYPAVILISGSGPQNRDQEILGHKPFLIIADHLARHGYAVLRYDDRGSYKSEGTFHTSTSKDFASDVTSAYQYLLSRNEIKSKKIGLIGHSEGGMIAAMVAAENKDIAFMISLAGPGLPGSEIVLLQQRLISEKSGISQDLITSNTAIYTTIFEMIRDIKDEEQLKTALTSYLKNAIKDLPPGFIPSTMSDDDFVQAQVQLYESPWMKYFLLYDPALDLQKVKCPTLVLNGAKDLQVPAEENMAAIEMALAKGKNKRAKTVVFPDLNHLFQECDTGLPSEYGVIEQTFAPQVLDEMVDWLKRWAK
ncbi:MAG: alpha/beta hydrolase [Chitinophagales bacterium]|nr:alpha/beta hydrolase [Chitinophagales bacterium]